MAVERMANVARESGGAISAAMLPTRRTKLGRDVARYASIAPMPTCTPEDRLAQHRANQRRHFQKRLRQRFGLEVTDRDVASIVSRIKLDKPGVVFLALQRRSSAWRLKWRHQTLVVIYDHHTEQLVTAFPFKRWKWQ